MTMFILALNDNNNSSMELTFEVKVSICCLNDSAILLKRSVN
jgi:hypothetical protein